MRVGLHVRVLAGQVQFRHDPADDAVIFDGLYIDISDGLGSQTKMPRCAAIAFSLKKYYGKD
jgi:hypothetical protein